MTITVKHLEDDILLNATQNVFKLSHNRRRNEGEISGVRSIALPDTSVWFGSYSASNVFDESINYQDQTSGYSAFEGVMEEIEEMDSYFTAFDTIKQFPRRSPVPDITYGVCEPITYPSEEELNALNSTRSSVFKFGLKGDSFVTLHYLKPDEWVLARGDQFSIHHGPLRIPSIYKVVNNVTSDSDGRATVKISPRLRMNVAVNDPITWYRPRGVFRLNSPFNSARTNYRQAEISFEIMEAPQIYHERNVQIGG